MGTTAVNIRDYIIDARPVDNNKFDDSYEILLQNNTDFIISKKVAKGARELVILISRGLFYFKEGDKIEDVTCSKAKAFLRDLKGTSITLEQVLWLPILDKFTVEHLHKVISDDTFVEMCRHNVLAGINHPEWYTGYWKQNQNLFIKLHSIFPTIGDGTTNKYRAALPVIFEIDKRHGFNEALYFAEVLIKSGIEQYSSSINGSGYYYGGSEPIDTKGFVQLLGEPYNLSLRRLIEYIFFDAYAQGFSRIDGVFWKTYEDCLSMQIKIHGKIREKYPKHLKTEHDILALKVNMMEIVAKCEDFADRSAEVKELEHKGKIYSIVVPDTPQQIADEGINLSHCVGSYVDRIINGDCHILFMRKSHAPDESLVTLQICKGRVNQAEGLHRRLITKEERAFLTTWGKAKGVQIAA